MAPLQLRHSLGMLPNFPEYSFSSLPQGKKQGECSIVFLQMQYKTKTKSPQILSKGFSLFNIKPGSELSSQGATPQLLSPL
jgi:hypothetical protein